MVNIHLNGDIVRCPDIRAAKLRHIERRDKNHICKYNIHEDTCSAWGNSLACWQAVKENNSAGRCKLSGSMVCPGHRKHVETGRQDKTFNIDNVTYRKMSSAAHDMVKTSQYRTLFLTLTFGKYKVSQPKKQCKNEFCKLLFEQKHNECFSKFMDNLRGKNYNCSAYIAVREYGDDNKRLHFHLLCALPYTNFITLNRAWCAAISDICHFSGNAIRTTKQTLFIKNPGKALKYVCKYFAKSKYNRSRTRIVFMSNNLIKKPIQRPDINVWELLQPYKGIYIRQSSDYSTVFRVTDDKSFMQFCNEFLYPAFNDAYNFPIFENKPCNFYVPGSG